MKVKMFYDQVFVTNLPAFYKINLYNRIAERKKILVIFLQDACDQRNNDFYKGKRKFESISLDRYHGIKKVLKFVKVLIKLEYGQLVISGWDRIEYWAAAFLSSKKKNAVVIESSIRESVTAGLKGCAKKIIMKRFSIAYVSGRLQAQLAQSLGFNGKLVKTKGVGLFNIVTQPKYEPVESVSQFLYVGRLSPEKNLTFLIETFNRLPDLTLNIVGFGSQENQLKELAGSNIRFLGAINNEDLPDCYRANQVLILPSISEVWGLVVEEALNNGLPVIVSSQVGCLAEVVIPNYNGLVFDPSDRDDLKSAILKLTDAKFYNYLRKNVSEMNFGHIAEEQVNSYL